MPTNRAYYTLVASLPALPSRCDVDRCPITWPRLEMRLRLLEADDQLTLKRLVDFLAWDRQPLQRTDQEVISHYRQLIATDGHAPGQFRALTVRNIDAWYDAFGVKQGDKLYLAPDERVKVW
jgi:hypothetical protein